MTRRELNIRIFEGTANAVLWQPRAPEAWVAHHRRYGTLPERFRNLDDIAIYDALRCSPRYLASAGLIQYYDSPDVQHEKKWLDDTHYADIIRIPEGELRTIRQVVKIDDKVTNDRIVEFPVNTPESLRVLTALVKREHFRADIEKFNAAAQRVGHRAEPTLFLGSSGFTDLIKWHCGLLNTYYLLHDHRSMVEEYLEACDERDDRKIDAALQLPCRIFNLGDHATNEFTPPPILKRYLLPRWQKISQRMKAHNRFVHTHWDGHSRLILPYLKKTGLHGVEALTPKPMGDITLEEIKAAVGDMVVLDLIPAILFLPEYSVQEVVEFARRVIDMFAPRLILGISDEISPRGQIEKIEAVSELVDKMCGLAE